MRGKRVVITGASRGVGLESCKLLLEAGAEIIGVARDRARLDAASALLGEFAEPGAFTAIAQDISAKGAAARIAEAVRRRWGALDMLLNNAGVQTYTDSYESEDVDLFERDLQTNVLGAHKLTKALLPLLLKGNEPRLINVSSGAGQRDVIAESTDMPAYRISKGTMNFMTIMQANALRGRVAVNSLDPGWLKTDLGGPDAPGEPADGGRAMMEVLALPFNVTGRFFHGAQEIEF